jgi:class 3 adenylate cyclase
VTETTAAIDAGRQEARPHELRKVVTVLFVDVSGPTALGDPLDTAGGPVSVGVRR